MLATFVIEFFFAFYTLWRYKMDTTVRLIFLILIALGIFQLSEYTICGGLDWTAIEWARLGYASITLLPALGIHLISSIAKRKNRILISLAYLSCAIFVVFYLFGQGVIYGQVCHPNYAVFNLHEYSGVPFGTYYYGWMLIGIFLAWHWGKKVNNNHQKTALYATIAGYLAFILPTTTFNIIDPSTIAGIPSIMCGFAVLFAATLVLVVLPNIATDKKSAKKLLKSLPNR